MDRHPTITEPLIKRHRIPKMERFTGARDAEFWHNTEIPGKIQTLPTRSRVWAHHRDETRSADECMLSWEEVTTHRASYDAELVVYSWAIDDARFYTRLGLVAGAGQEVSGGCEERDWEHKIPFIYDIVSTKLLICYKGCRLPTMQNNDMCSKAVTWFIHTIKFRASFSLGVSVDFYVGIFYATMRIDVVLGYEISSLETRPFDGTELHIFGVT